MKLSRYNLDYPADVSPHLTDPSSRFYARSRPRTLDLARHLPYATETPQDAARFLSHIVSHLYVAICTLDLSGSISVSAKDIERLRKEREREVVEEIEEEEEKEDVVDDEDEEIKDYDSEWEQDDDEEGDEFEESGDFEDDGNDQPDVLDAEVSQHKRVGESAAHVSVATWTNELLVWLKMKHEMPVSLRASLVRVYYAICVSRGQDLSLRVFVRAFEQLVKNEYGVLLQKHGLVLPWEPLYRDMENLFPSVEEAVDNFERKDHKMLLRLAARASDFFPGEALPRIYAGMCSRLDMVNCSTVVSNLAMLPRRFGNGIDDPHDVRHYIASLFYVWAKLSKAHKLDIQMTTRLGLVAMSALQQGVALGPYGIFSREQITFVIKTLMNSLSINVAKYASSRAKYFHGYASVIVCSMVGDAPDIMQHVSTVLNAIESYIHPSNAGEWTKPVSRMVHALVHQFHKRYVSEKEEHGGLSGIDQAYKLTDGLVAQFVDALLPLVKTGMQSKSTSVSGRYLMVVRMLAHMDPPRVMEYFLVDIYESLEGVISTHRVSAALQCIEALMRYLAETPIYRVHITRLLSMSLPGIDSNDLEKSIYALDVFAAAANFIPFGEIEGSDDDVFLAVDFTSQHLAWLSERIYTRVDKERVGQHGDAEGFLTSAFQSESFEELESAALRSSAASFKTIVKTMLDRIVMLLENIPDPSKSEGLEKHFAESLPKLLCVLFESFSADVFDCFYTGFFEFVLNNTIHTVADIAAEICGGLMRRDPSRFERYAPILMDKIREDIEENGAGASRTGVDIVPRDQALFWNLVILNECIGNAGAAVLPHAAALTDFSFFLMDSVKGPAVFASAYLVNSLLQTVTQIRLLENRLLPPGMPITQDTWGAYQFRPERLENLDFEWFVPGQAHVDFAIRCFDAHVQRSLENMHRIMGEPDADADELRVNILYLGYALSGAAHLFDPGYKEENDEEYESLGEILKEMKLDDSSDQHDSKRRKGIVAESSLYTCNYYFSDKNSQYRHLHRTRALIGKALHLVCGYLTANFIDNTKLFKNFLFVLNIWFSDMGRERVLGTAHAKVNFGYVKFLQKIARVRKPYTRVALGARIECYHNLRVALHATARAQTSAERALLEDVVRMSVSTYMAISGPAQSLLASTMKWVSGAYAVVIRAAFRHLSQALDEGHIHAVECGLAMFGMAKIKNRLMNDTVNLKQFLALLYRCFMVDKMEVSASAYALFEGVSESISPPPRVCLIDMKEIEIIDPNEGDQNGKDSVVSFVKLAKEKKRRAIMQRLVDIEAFVVDHEHTSTYWKTSYVNLKVLVGLQEELEMPTNPKVYELLGERTSSDHPVNAHLVLKSVTNLVDKIVHFSRRGYDMRRVFGFEVSPRVKQVPTNVPGGYYTRWKAELKAEEPSYYVDYSATAGWLFWDDQMYVSNPQLQPEQFSDVDRTALARFGHHIDKARFGEIVQLWLSDNETTGTFSGTNVFLVSVVVQLISYGLLENLSLAELLATVSEVYSPDDRSTHIVACEVICGLLLCSKYLTSEMAQERDAFVSAFLQRVFDNDLSPDNRGVWRIFSWWLTARIDCRRFPSVMKVLMDLHIDPSGDSAVRQATRISFLRSVASMAAWRNPYTDALAPLCLDNIHSEYEVIRTQIGSLMGVVSVSYYAESVENAQTFVRLCNEQRGLQLYTNTSSSPIDIRSILDKVESYRKEVETLPAHEILNSKYFHCTATLLTCLNQNLLTSVAVLYQPHVVSHIVPFLLRLTEMKEVCQLGDIDPTTTFKRVSQIPYTTQYFDDVVGMLEDYAAKDLSIIQTIIIGEFTETFYFKNLLSMDSVQRSRVIDLTARLCYHRHVEVRENAAQTLSGLIHSSSPAEMASLVPEYCRKFTADLDAARKVYKNRKTRLSAADTATMHGATLGLGALVHAFAFMSPPPSWVRVILATLANKSSGLPGVIGKTANNTLATFKKNRQDTWHIDSRMFSAEQIQDWEGVLGNSYFI